MGSDNDMTDEEIREAEEKRDEEENARKKAYEDIAEADYWNEHRNDD
jgi:hypothetical protein